MEAHVDLAGLAPGREGELVAIRREMAEAIHRRGRPVRDHTVSGRTFPRRNFGSELKPCGAECKVVRGRRARQAVHTASHSLEDCLVRQALESRLREACLLSLS